MSDLHATERIIGGLIVVGVASLLNWNHSQGGESGLLGAILIGAMVLGGVWVAIGLFELLVGQPLGRREHTTSTSSPEPAHLVLDQPALDFPDIPSGTQARD